MAKEITLTFSDGAYQALETMAQEVSCSTDQVIREALALYHNVVAAYEANPQGRLIHEAESSQPEWPVRVELKLSPGSALDSYIQKGRKRRGISPDLSYVAISEYDPSKLFRSTDKK